MEAAFIQKLVERNVITTGTEVEAFFKAVDLSGVPQHEFVGYFVVLGVKPTSGGFVLDCVEAVDGRRRRQIEPEKIISVDGMGADRLGAVYCIRPDGTEFKGATKRGRKPKAKQPA